ncbi:MAG: hypothetical protein R3A10_15865 [Caldilineaceae bacterium]
MFAGVGLTPPAMILARRAGGVESHRVLLHRRRAAGGHRPLVRHFARGAGIGAAGVGEGED